MYLPPSDAVVGLEKTFYSVNESEGVVEVCAAVMYCNSPSTECPIAFPFNVSLSTDDDSAGIVGDKLLCSSISCMILYSAVAPMDYGALSTILMFAGCQNRNCVNISIEDDAVVENAELFNVTLERAEDLDSRIMLNRSRVDGKIEIKDNDGMCCRVQVFNPRPSDYRSINH